MLRQTELSFPVPRSPFLIQSGRTHAEGRPGWRGQWTRGNEMRPHSKDAGRRHSDCRKRDNSVKSAHSVISVLSDDVLIMLLMGLAAGPHEQRGTGHGDNVRSGMSRGERAERMVAVASYVHGYSEHEALRLGDQADILAELLHADTAYPAGSRVLEVGCAVGAQTVHLVAGSPAARIVAVDLSSDSLAQARARVAAQAPEETVKWHRADLFNLPFADAAFDHLFVCFVLEHLPDPTRALAGFRRVLRPGGAITVIEGDHGSAFFHPDSAHARAAIDCLVRLQSAAGGNALLGRQLQPLLATAGYRDVVVRPRTV